MQVISSKTSEPMQIPIFAKLRSVLEKQSRRTAYVFPEVAKLFTSKTDNTKIIIVRLKRILKLAGIDYDKRNLEFTSKAKRLRQASISGMHAMKTTFVTIALNAGVPEATVKKVVGNQMVDVVLKHYYRPGREMVAESMRTHLPAELTGEQPSESVHGLLLSMNGANWEVIRDRVLRMLPRR